MNLERSHLAFSGEVGRGPQPDGERGEGAGYKQHSRKQACPFSVAVPSARSAMRDGRLFVETDPTLRADRNHIRPSSPALLVA